MLLHWGDFDEAISSRRFHLASRFDLTPASCASSSSNFLRHSSNSAGSWSMNIFRTFRLKLWTAWFQWPFVFRSNAGKIMGSITLLFCLIKLSIWSLFHRKRALSATCGTKKKLYNISFCRKQLDGITTRILFYDWFWESTQYGNMSSGKRPWDIWSFSTVRKYSMSCTWFSAVKESTVRAFWKLLKQGN